MYSSKTRPSSGDVTETDAGVRTIADEAVQPNDIELARNAMLIGAATGAQALALTQGGIPVGGATDIAELAAEGDGKIIVGNGTTVTSVAVSGDATLTNAGVATLANDAVNEAKTADSDGTSGLYVMKYALALYDFATDGGGAPGAIVLQDPVTIPDNAVVELVSYDVLTTFTTAGADAGTIKVGLVTDGDLSTAIAVSDGTNPWDAGAHLGSVVTPVIAKTTAARLIQVTSAGQAITAGKAVFCFRYYVTS